MKIFLFPRNSIFLITHYTYFIKEKKFFSETVKSYRQKNNIFTVCIKQTMPMENNTIHTYSQLIIKSRSYIPKYESSPNRADLIKKILKA